MTFTFKQVLVEYKYIQLKFRENMMVYSFDLDFDPMTLLLKHDLHMVKMYLHTKNEVSSYNSSEVMAWTDWQTNTHTDRQTDRQTHTHRQIGVKQLPTAYADSIKTDF